MTRIAAIALLGLALGACDAPTEPGARFPAPDRPVSEIGSNQFSTEDQRDSRGEAQTVMDLAEIEPGMTVADIGRQMGRGAGEALQLGHDTQVQLRQIVAVDVGRVAVVDRGVRRRRHAIVDWAVRSDGPGLGARSWRDRSVH